MSSYNFCEDRIDERLKGIVGHRGEQSARDKVASCDSDVIIYTEVIARDVEAFIVAWRGLNLTSIQLSFMGALYLLGEVLRLPYPSLRLLRRDNQIYVQ